MSSQPATTTIPTVPAIAAAAAKAAVAADAPVAAVATATIRLCDAAIGQPMTVAMLRPAGAVGAAGGQVGEGWQQQLADLGFTVGERAVVMRRGWPGGDPLAVRVGSSTFALRRAEAACVLVEPCR